MYSKYLKYFISFIAAPIEALFIPSPLVFDELVLEVIKNLQSQSEHKCSIVGYLCIQQCDLQA